MILSPKSLCSLGLGLEKTIAKVPHSYPILK